jgi:small-conductance mechanosensitive channel
MNDKLIKVQALYSLIDYEPMVILLSLVMLAWIFYKLFLHDASEERHTNLKKHFRNLLRHSIIFSILFVVFKFFFQTEDLLPSSARVLPYLALLTFLWGSLIFVKTSRLLILQYLFLGSMKAGVPVLIVNIFSLMFSLALALWSANYIFGFQFAPLLATSAAFSIILGLALQDTLGNLIAGISLQVDKTFEIGDWLEVQVGSNRIVGQVKEITWRSTVLVGWSDEVITIPNRALANSQLSNFFAGQKPILRNQIFRLPLQTDTELAKECLLESLRENPRIRQDLPPLVYISETTDSWLAMKAAYYIDSYGSQFGIGDLVLASGLKYLKANGIEPAHQTIQIGKDMR